jgi:Uma2 family endonuclease
MIMMIYSIDELNPNSEYTYADYLMWQFQERVELLRGRLFQMAAPNVKHMNIAVRLTSKLFQHFELQPCTVFAAPFDVRLPLPPHKITAKKMDTVVQPDLGVICDESKLDTQGCIGAPDLVIEILSEGILQRELREKYEIYEAAGVRGYWIFEPENQYVLLYFLDEKTNRFISTSRPLIDGDVLTSYIFPDLKIDVTQIFSKNGRG